MRILIVDDEPIARSRLVRLLGRIEGVEVAGEAANGNEALAQAEALAPDVMLLDIDMPGLDGLAVAETPGVPPVIFTTAHPHHALDAFEADAHDYLLKPISRERLERALEKVRVRRAAAEQEPWRLVVTAGSLKRFVDAREVESFIADQKYLVFRVGDEELLLRESLDALEARLAPFGFLRVNRGALVRRDAVRAYDTAEGGAVVLASGERIPVSRRAAAAVREALNV
ncbi:MAG: LytTR family DNA-binding domain-containing protein [Sandaracinaceae bacterium]|nr:MAG: response regulator transcription factor [Sandaracinaceae bacterium]HBQ17506.1 DNA-binding response regulator [Myxococcales bacterium]